MAGFYDLCVGYDGLTELSRREVVSMAMQLGYSGIAYNHVVSGLISDSDRCKMKPIELASLEAARAGVLESARFHQRLLGLPEGSQFRQHSRITLVSNDSSVTELINSSLVLRSYDLVAVRPTTLKAFKQACRHLKVDIVSVDFNQKLPFRMQLHVVKAAIERGIFFEITYGGAISDLNIRRQVLANAQMLQSWTKGKNIILSSGAERGMELRGPNDVANLSTLFGLSAEHAKAAISKNCKSAILHGVMRRKAHKGAISVVRCQADGNLGSDKLLFDIPTVWDPLTSVFTERDGRDVPLMPPASELGAEGILNGGMGAVELKSLEDESSKQAPESEDQIKPDEMEKGMEPGEQDNVLDVIAESVDFKGLTVPNQSHEADSKHAQVSGGPSGQSTISSLKRKRTPSEKRSSRKLGFHVHAGFKPGVRKLLAPSQQGKLQRSGKKKNKKSNSRQLP